MESTPTSRRRNILDNDITMLRTISMTPRSQRRGWDRRRLHDAKMEPTSTYNVEMEPTEDIRGQGRSRRRRGCVVMSPVVTFDLATPPFFREWSYTQILSTITAVMGCYSQLGLPARIRATDAWSSLIGQSLLGTECSDQSGRI